MGSLLKEISIRLASALLMVVLLFPYGKKLDHLLEDHQHIACTSEVESHIHEGEFDCDFSDYQITKINSLERFSLQDPVELLHESLKLSYESLFLTPEYCTSFQRGPPSLG